MMNAVFREWEFDIINGSWFLGRIFLSLMFYFMN